MPTGQRIRANNVYGIISDNPLTIGATTMNSTGLSVLPAVLSAHAVLVLDPKRVFGEPEIVVITSHTSGNTAAIISRGQYGTAARAHPINTSWAHIAIDEDYTEIVTTTTRPTNPYMGQMIFETDTIGFKFWNGSTWSAISTGAGGSGGGVAATLAYAQVTANQTAITTETDLIGLSVSVTVPAGRRLKITGRGIVVKDATANYSIGWIYKDGVKVGKFGDDYLPINGESGWMGSYIDTPTAGTHTYKLSMRSFGGAVSLYADNSTDQGPAFILVEDITSSETPFSNPNVPVDGVGVISSTIR